jgi:hypothetical protein
VTFLLVVVAKAPYASALLAIGVVLASPRWGDRLPPLHASLGILLSPLVLLGWVALNTEVPFSQRGMPLAVLNILALLVVGAVLGVAVRFRRSPSGWLLILCSVSSLALTALLTIGGAMVITGNAF